MSDEIPVEEWIESIYDELKKFVNISPPIGDSETGLLMSAGFKNLTLVQLADAISLRAPDDRERLCRYLAAALMTYVIERAIHEFELPKGFLTNDG